MSLNRLWNTKNPNQGPQKKVLALCSAGLLRSPTLAWVLSNDPYNYNTRAAGVNQEYALIKVDQYLIAWADEIVCVEPYIADELIAFCEQEEIELAPTPVVVLDIPDVFKRRQQRLVEIIEKQYADWIHAADKPVDSTPEAV